MISILIFYPDLFNVKEKFNRKVAKIIEKIDDSSVFYLADPNNFISDFFSSSTKRVQLNPIASICDVKITHAIIFDDGLDFMSVNKSYLVANGINYRHIHVPITRVVNIDKEPEYKQLKSTDEYEYIGRGSYWGNPYSMYDFVDDGEDNSREAVIRKFQYDFDRDIFPNKEKKYVFKLLGKKLGCFCKPEACHGDVLANYLNSWDDGK